MKITLLLYIYTQKKLCPTEMVLSLAANFTCLFLLFLDTPDTLDICFEPVGVVGPELLFKGEALKPETFMTRDIFFATILLR